MTAPQTDARKTLAIGESAPLKDRLRNGDAMSGHDERLREEAADALDARDAVIADLVEAGDALARQAFCTMTGGHGHLIDDMCAALAKAAALK